MGGIIISIIGAVVIAVSTLIVTNPNSDFSLNSKAYTPKEDVTGRRWKQQY